MSNIEVGKVGDKIFIGVPTEHAEVIKKPLSGKKLQTISISRDVAAWLVGALRKELANDVINYAEDYMDDELEFS